MVALSNCHYVIYKKIDGYVLSRLDEDVQCDAVAIRELCELRDSCDDLMFDCNELHIFIEALCCNDTLTIRRQHKRENLSHSVAQLVALEHETGNLTTLVRVQLEQIRFYR